MGRVRGGPGQAEIEDLDAAAAAFQPDVGRLDVAVDQAVLVGRRQPLGDLPADAQHLGDGQLASRASRRSSSGSPLQELHGQEGHAAVLADLVDGDDVVVLDGGRGLGLAQEALPGLRGWRPGPAAWP